MNRRVLLANAGCLTSTDDAPATASSPDPTTGSPSPGPDSPTPTSVDGITLDRLVARKNATYEAAMGSGGVLADPGRQYVVARVRAGRELEPSAFRVETDDRTTAPGFPGSARSVTRSVAGLEGVTLDGAWTAAVPGILAVALPSPLETERARLRLDASGGPTETWPLPEPARRRLAAPEPRFELDDLSVPGAVDPPAPLDASLTVTNVAETAGRLLAAVYWPTRVADDDESRILDRQVGAGETVAVSLDVDTRRTAREDGAATLGVRGHVTAERSVRVEGTPTPTG